MKRRPDKQNPRKHAERSMIISKDDVMSLTIDLKVLSTEEIYSKHFAPNPETKGKLLLGNEEHLQ